MTATPQDDVLACLQERRNRVEGWLSTYLSPREGCPDSLLEAMRYSLLAPGKRLRPILALLTAEAAGGNLASALPAAAAVEMVHVYSLIHDDLPAMDDDDLRRGQPTCHKKFGEALAILAGDGLLTLSFQVLSEHYPPATAAGCCLELSRAAGACGMVGGQVDDLAMESLPASSRKTNDAETILEKLHARKTGALFCSSLRLGVWAVQGERAGGPDRELLDRVDTFGRCFGLAFQISDDLLDVEGNADATGKRVNKDAARGKLTYPELWGIDDSRRRAADLCQRACESVHSLGEAGRLLANLAALLVDRKS